MSQHILEESCWIFITGRDNAEKWRPQPFTHFVLIIIPLLLELVLHRANDLQLVQDGRVRVFPCCITLAHSGIELNQPVSSLRSTRNQLLPLRGRRLRQQHIATLKVSECQLAKLKSAG